MSDPINDATAYGVRIVEADVTPGTLYWKITRVHHLTPEENQGRHHIYLDALSEDGQRLFGTHVLISWDGGDEVVVIEKAPPEPGANFPMWKWQVCNAEVDGAISDRVENLRTDHPDEGPGNTLFHHSFAITFQQTVATSQGPDGESSISGRVPQGSGHTLLLADTEGSERVTIVAENETYRFEKLPAGRYTITDQVDGRVVGPVELDGVNALVLDFPPLALDTQPIEHLLLFGPVGAPATQLYISLLADYIAEQSLALAFTVTDAVAAKRVTLVGEHTQDTRTALETAGCEVDELPTDPSALLEAIEGQS